MFCFLGLVSIFSQVEDPMERGPCIQSTVRNVWGILTLHLKCWKKKDNLNSHKNTHIYILTILKGISMYSLIIFSIICQFENNVDIIKRLMFMIFSRTFIKLVDAFFISTSCRYYFWWWDRNNHLFLTIKETLKMIKFPVGNM